MLSAASLSQKSSSSSQQQHCLLCESCGAGTYGTPQLEAINRTSESAACDACPQGTYSSAKGVATVWELPEDGDVVVEDNELQQNPMKRKSFIKIVDDEHGVFFQDVETEESVWELPEDGNVVVEDDGLQENPH